MENLDKSRRRSFVDVRRKSLIFDQIFNDENNRTNSHDSLRISIRDYIESLEKERQQWKDILHSRKKLFKQIKEKKESDPLIIKQEDVESIVTEEEKMFLSGKPDYLKMLNNIKKYVDSVSYADRYKNDLIKRYEEITSVVEMQRKMLVDKMCADDRCEICNVKDCTDPEHKFVT